jgi:hypothetical protein
MDMHGLICQDMHG